MNTDSLFQACIRSHSWRVDRSHTWLVDFVFHVVTSSKIMTDLVVQLANLVWIKITACFFNFLIASSRLLFGAIPGSLILS